jgi:fluoride exporter
LLERYLLVAAGGATGSMVRYLVTRVFNDHFGDRFPFGTLCINLGESFLIGLLLVIFDRKELLHPNLRPLVITGVLGGFTTFSAFEWETFSLGRTSPSLAILYCGSSVVVGFLACWLGVTLARRF